MTSRRSYTVRAGIVCGLLANIAAVVVTAQYAVRPEDPLGLSIREPRVRVVHTTTPELPGGSMHLQMTDPWQAYQRGRSYFFREWNRTDGIFRALPDRPEAAIANSCGMCHNLPFPSTGSGGNVGIRVGVGRSSPHLFGAGLLETVGIQIRAQLFEKYDTNRNGYFDVPAETKGIRAMIEASPGAMLDFGSFDDFDGNGIPDLNPTLMIRFVRRNGDRLLFDDSGSLARLVTPDVVGFDVAVGVFSSSAGDHQFPSLRSFATGVFTTILGIVPDAPSIPTNPQKFSAGFISSKWGSRSNAGAFLSEVLLIGRASDYTEQARRPTVGEGELDMLEWFQVNQPRPAVDRQTAQTRRGRVVLDELGCTTCHVARWDILPASVGKEYPGDRRLFDLDVQYNAVRDRLEGTLRKLTREESGPNGATYQVPKREGFVLDDVFTDFRHHDVGSRFHEYEVVAGEIVTHTEFKTPALWGVGSSGPYGHDGRSLSLDAVIRRHGGEAGAASAAYAAAPSEDRDTLLAFLRSLVLYQPEMLPTDLDGDGRILTSYKARGVDLGAEVFRPEFFLRVAPRYRGWTTGPDGGRYFSHELLNVKEAYGADLEGLRDSIGDGWPDVARKAPHTAGSR